MIAKSEAERAEQRLQNILDQLRAYENGEQHSIICPYCAKINNPKFENFCCEMFGKASLAALERLRVEQSTQIVKHLVN